MSPSTSWLNSCCRFLGTASVGCVLAGVSLVSSYAPAWANPNPTIISQAPTSVPPWINALKLSPAQTTQVQGLEAKYRPQVTQLQTQLNQAEGAMEKLLVQGASNEDIRAQHQVIQNNRRQLEAVRLEAALELKAILTPGQRQELANLNQKRLERLRNQVFGPNSTTGTK